MAEPEISREEAAAVRAEIEGVPSGFDFTDLAEPLRWARTVVALYDRLASYDALEVYGTLRAENEAMRECLLALVEHEDRPCRFDHDGDCQEHGGGSPCDVARARDLLGLSHG